jgi:hypothetical protein
MEPKALVRFSLDCDPGFFVERGFVPVRSRPMTGIISESFRFALQPNLQQMRIFEWMRLYPTRIERFDKSLKPLIT